MAKKASSLLNSLRKSTGSISFKESTWAIAPHYISTGDYGVNQIISGSIFKGIPAGKVSVFAGESGSLKTVQVVRVAANALNELDYDVVFYFDSEGGAPAGMFENFGCDLSKIEHILVESTEDAAVKMVTTLKTIEKIQKEEDPNFKAVVILDSLGNLENDKTFKDIENNRLAADQGAGAKVKNKLCRAMTIPALKTGTPVLIINWVYDGPSLYTKKIKDQPGGKGSEFVGSINVQCSKLLVKSEDKDPDNYYENSLVTMFTVKNREVTPYLSTQVHVSFTEGLNLYPYLSLFDSAVELGFITKESTQFYTVPSCATPEKKFRKKQLIGGDLADEIWSNFLEDYDKKAFEKIQYSKVTEQAIEELGFTNDEAKELIFVYKDEDEKDDA
jgi:RecA/RadA recombinase